MQSYYIDKPEDIDKIAEDLLSDYPNARVFAFYGPMGSGKTTFIKGICRYLKVKDEPTSPTFSIVNEYITEGEENVYHFDFYRIEKVSELYDIGYHEYVNGNNYCFIEWPELAEEVLPEDIIKIKIEVESSGTRKLDIL